MNDQVSLQRCIERCQGSVRDARRDPQTQRRASFRGIKPHLLDDAPGSIATVETSEGGAAPSQDAFPSDVEVQRYWGDVHFGWLLPAAGSCHTKGRTSVDTHTWRSRSSTSARSVERCGTFAGEASLG